MEIKKLSACLVLGLFLIFGFYFDAQSDNQDERYIECEYIETNEQYLIFKCSDIHGFTHYLKYSVEFILDIINEYFIPEIMNAMETAKENLNHEKEEASQILSE